MLDAWADPTGDFATFERLAHDDGSSLLIERDQELPAELVERLCQIVFWRRTTSARCRGRSRCSPGWPIRSVTCFADL